MNLIDKDAVVAEIEKLIKRAKAERVLYPKTILAAKNYLLIEDYNKLLSFLDTLEPKEVVELDKVRELLRDYEIKLPNGIIRFDDALINDVCKILQNES